MDLSLHAADSEVGLKHARPIRPVVCKQRCRTYLILKRSGGAYTHSEEGQSREEEIVIYAGRWKKARCLSHSGAIEQESGTGYIHGCMRERT